MSREREHEGFDPSDDAAVAIERTALAWNRTGLSAAAGGALAMNIFWGKSPLGLALAALLLAVGALAYSEGARSYRMRRDARVAPSPIRIRALSIAVGISALLSAVIGYSGAGQLGVG